MDTKSSCIGKNEILQPKQPWFTVKAAEAGGEDKMM